MHASVTTRTLSSDGVEFAIDDVVFRSASSITAHLPFVVSHCLGLAGLSYGIRPSGLIDDAMSAFRLGRLKNINQLGYEHMPVPSQPAAGLTWPVFPHSRFHHVCDTMALASLMGINADLSSVARQTLRLAAILHDVLTPVGGDTLKEIEREALDEDRHFSEALRSPDWPALRDRYDIPAALLVETVQGQGPLGCLLDIADKLAYTARDVAEYLDAARSAPVVDSRFRAAIYALIAKRPLICGLWDTVRVEGDTVFFTDPAALADFLKLRVLMFRHVYHGDRTKFARVMAACVLTFLYQTGKLTRADLLRLDDRDFETDMLERTGLSPRAYDPILMGCPIIEKYDSEDEARRREAELHAQGIIFTLVRDLRGFINPATHFCVQTPDGRIMPFRDARPVDAREIEGWAVPTPSVRLYALPGLKVKPAFLADYTLFRHGQYVNGSTLLAG